VAGDGFGESSVGGLSVDVWGGALYGAPPHYDLAHDIRNNRIPIISVFSGVKRIG
jgi:hypothetical protein